MIGATPAPNYRRAERDTLNLVAALAGGNQTREQIEVMVAEMIDGRPALDVGRSLLVASVVASVALHGWANEADADPLDILMEAEGVILARAS